jgi:hypothetical protein
MRGGGKGRTECGRGFFEKIIKMFVEKKECLDRNLVPVPNSLL